MTSVIPESIDAPDGGSEKKWWLAIRGRAEGPYSAGYITASLLSKSEVPGTLACLVGTQEWKPLTDWAEFGDARRLVPPPIPPQPLDLALSDSPFTNANLPSMANWLCGYCIVWRPVISIFALLNWPPSFAVLLLGPQTSLLVTAALVTGGIRLRHRRRSGATIIKISLWVALGVTTLIMLGILLVALGSIGSASPPTTSETTPQVVPQSQSAADALMLLLWLFELVFQVFAVVWLWRNGDRLPYLSD